MRSHCDVTNHIKTIDRLSKTTNKKTRKRQETVKSHKKQEKSVGT